MHKKTKEYIQKSLDGIWSPFFRRRIRREILDHISDLINEKNISEVDAVNYLGDAEESNILYKDLMYKKLRSDSIFYGGLLSLLFVIGVFYIHSKVNEYNRWALGKYQKIEKKYKKEVVEINHFHRGFESKNAALFLDSIFDSNDNLMRDDFLEELQRFDYWDPVASVDGEKKEYFEYAVIQPSRIARLAKLATEKLRQSKHSEKAKKNYSKVAKLIYSTETMSGYRIANNMLDYNLFDEKGKLQFYFKTRANRASGTTWGLLSLMPQIILFEKTFRDVNYYATGICHHAYDFWFGDILYKNFTKSSFPFELGWERELTAYQNVKNKMKKDCRLSFLRVTSSPDPIDQKAMWVMEPESSIFGLIHENLIVSASQVPYLRNLASRYFVYRTSIQIQGYGEKHYAQN